MGEQKTTPPKGRGTGANPTGRFESTTYEADPQAGPTRVETRVYEDASRSILARNQSPDLGFEYSLNPYRGCEHGCAYCYARPYHEYLGFSAGLDFETKIMAKRDAAQLLARELRKPRYVAKTIAFSGATDAYQPLEKSEEITRACLEVLADFRHPAGVITKNHLVTRDADLLGRLATHDAAKVYLSLHSLDAELVRDLEPRASSPAMRLRAVRELAEAGIPVGVMVGPVIPGLNDHEIPAVLEAAKEAGAQFASYVSLRLPHGVGEIFEAWLETYRPLKREKVLRRVRDTQGGKLSDARFGKRFRGSGPVADSIRRLFELTRKRLGLAPRGPQLSAAAFRDPAGVQGTLFG